jgi:hypothetical protein
LEPNLEVHHYVYIRYYGACVKYSDFLHTAKTQKQLMQGDVGPRLECSLCWRYERCWWHLTLHIINVEKNVSRLLFHFFFFLICVCIPWVWLGWRWCGCVLMYCSLCWNFTFCFYWFLFYFGLLVYICVVGVFL